MRRFILFVLVCCLTIGGLMAQGEMPQLPLDPSTKVGKLPNGLTYFIRHNEKPEGQAFFYIVQKVGSVQEEESQRGLAHFLEHMCFYGTKHFASGEIDKYLASIGCREGADVNAYTSTDETVYNIDNVPVTPGHVDSCLLILRDWAGDVVFPEASIAKQREVIHEEWRYRTSAMMRIIGRQLENLYPNSKYGRRMPIGLMEVVDGCDPQRLFDYYQTWYRPDLQGIVVVGDIDVDEIEGKIKAMFSDLKNPENEQAFEYYPVPDHAEPIYISDQDKEISSPRISVNFQYDPIPHEMCNTPVYMGNDLCFDLLAAVLNERLAELRQQADCPFLMAGGGNDNYLISKTKNAFALAIIPKEGQEKEAMERVMKEVERIRRYGVNPGELQRQIDEIVSQIEMAYENREQTESSVYVHAAVRHFLDNTPMLSEEMNLQLVKMMTQQIQPQVIAQMAAQVFASVDSNFVCFATSPEKEGYKMISNEELREAVMAARNAELEPLVETVDNSPLVSSLPKAGKVKKVADFVQGAKVWTLSNGIKVYLKQTDFDKSEVRMTAKRWGGLNEVSDADYQQASYMSSLANKSGLGTFTYSDLNKKLAGKQVGVGVALENNALLQGSATPKDLRTLFELTFLRLSEPYRDDAEFQRSTSQDIAQLINMEGRPEIAFQDSVNSVVYGKSLRTTITHADQVKALDYDKMLDIYRKQFTQHASNFDFFFVGNFDEDSLRLYCEQYLASLPKTKAGKRAAIVSRRQVEGVNECRFSIDMPDPKPRLMHVRSGEIKYSLLQDMAVDAYAYIMRDRMDEEIREKAGLTYGVGTMASLRRLTNDYVVMASTNSRPTGVDSCLVLINQELEKLAAEGVTADEMTKFKEYMIKNYKESQKQNGYWMGIMQEQVTYGSNSQDEFEATLEKLSADDVKAFAQKVCEGTKRSTITMLPNSFEEKNN